MFATLLTLAFTAAALLAGAVIASSLAKGLAAASSLRQQLAHCSGERLLTVRHFGVSGMREVSLRPEPRRASGPVRVRPTPARLRAAA